MLEVSDETLKLMAVFQKHAVMYLIVGGFAVNRYGYRRTTGDLDLYIKDTADNRQNLVNALDEMQYGRMEVLLTTPMLAGYCEIMMDEGMYADLMTELPGLPKEDFDEHFAMATVDLVDGIPMRFLHYNHLIENKKKTGRKKDLADVAELEKLDKRTDHL